MVEQSIQELETMQGLVTKKHLRAIIGGSEKGISKLIKVQFEKYEREVDPSIRDFPGISISRIPLALALYVLKNAAPHLIIQPKPIFEVKSTKKIDKNRTN